MEKQTQPESKYIAAREWAEQVEVDYWPVDIFPYDPETYEATITTRQGGGYVLCGVKVSPHILQRKNHHIRRSEIADVLLIKMRRGNCIVSFGDDDFTITPSDFCLVNGWQQYTLKLEEGSEILTFRMPSSALEARSKVKTEILAFKRIDASSGLPKLAASFLEESYSQLDHIPRGQDRVLFNNLASVISASLHTMPDMENNRSTHHEELIRSIRRYIEANIEDDTLNAEHIARAHGFSLRYLNKIFESEHDTAVKYIRSLRLRLFSQRLLTNTSQCTIKELVFQCGFSDYAHFHRVFKQHFQCTPNQYRDKYNSTGAA